MPPPHSAVNDIKMIAKHIVYLFITNIFITIARIRNHRHVFNAISITVTRIWYNFTKLLLHKRIRNLGLCFMHFSETAEWAIDDQICVKEWKKYKMLSSHDYQNYNRQTSSCNVFTRTKTKFLRTSQKWKQNAVNAFFPTPTFPFQCIWIDTNNMQQNSYTHACTHT